MEGIKRKAATKNNPNVGNIWFTSLSCIKIRDIRSTTPKTNIHSKNNLGKFCMYSCLN